MLTNVSVCVGGIAIKAEYVCWLHFRADLELERIRIHTGYTLFVFGIHTGYTLYNPGIHM